MKRRIIYGLLLAGLAVNLVVGALIFFRPAQAAEKETAYPSLELFSYVMERVRKDYVDGKKLTYEELVYGALKGMINTLDPHSEFMEPAKYDELQHDTQGKFGGLGIVVEWKDNFVTVVAPMEGTPGFRAGILPGDRIIKIDGKTGQGLQDAIDHLRGAPGSPVTITILRPSTGKVEDMVVTREEIKVDMVKDVNNKKEFPLGPDKIGYVHLVQFGEQAGAELETALRRLKSQNMEALIVDLRNNPGGLLDQAVDVCSKFLPVGQLVVSTEGQNVEKDTKRFFADGRGDELKGMPMVVLVNYNSASASEIVAGCLQDTGRAWIMGEKTFGKGSVQSIIPLPPMPDGSPALKLTTAKYYTPSHKVIHGQGVTPDSIVPMTDNEEDAVIVKQRRPTLDTLDEKEQQQLKGTHDVQLERAMDQLRGMLIFTHRSTAGRDVASRTGPEKSVSGGK